MTNRLATYRTWICERALPAWATRGFDPQAGRFRERLDQTGDPIEVPHRSMVQARQIYVFAHAATLGWFADGGPLAEQAMASLLRDFREDAGEQTSFAFSVDPGGRRVSDVRDAYAHAFVLFSIAALYRLNGDAALLDVADRTIRFIDGGLSDATHGGLFDAAPIMSRDKRQNPHMHLLEAYLFLEQAAPGRGYLDRATQLVDLFKRRLFDERTGVLLEYFAQDWSALADPVRSVTWEPGHHFEWVWLLGEYARLSGTDMTDWETRLYNAALDDGVAPGGLIYDELAGDDRRVLKPSHRVWPHTEAIKAAATRHSAGDPNAAAFAEAMAGGLSGTFLDKPFPGGWIDHVDPAGRPLVAYVPASSLYHLFLASTEAARCFSASARLADPVI